MGDSEDAIRYAAVVVGGCAFFYFFFLRRLCVDTMPRNMGVYAALRSPSVREARNALERRIALAVREANSDPRACPVCVFANTTKTAVSSCALCGAALPLPPKFGLSRFLSSASAVLSPPSPLPPAAESGRQMRVRRRQEWTRQVCDGQLSWRHDEQLCDAKLDKFPFYVLQSSAGRKPWTPPNTHSSAGANSSPGPALAELTAISVVVNGSAPTPDLTTAQAADRLRAQLQATTVRVVDVLQADPAHVAFSTSSLLPPIDDGAQLTFPHKLVNFVTSVASLIAATNEADMPTISRLYIPRDEIWTNSVKAIAALTPDAARRPIRVEFIGEPGVDAGALYREWVGLLNQSLTDPEAGVFAYLGAHEQAYYLNPTSRDVLGDDHLVHFLVAGRLIGRALLDGNVTGFRLAPPLLKIMSGLPVSFADLEYFDAEAFKSLQWLLENDGVDLLGLDFTVVEKLPDGRTREVELVRGGSSIDVTDVNKLDYIDRKLQYVLFDSVADQLFAFLTGLYEVVPAELLVAFDAEELGYLLSGSDEIDVDDWEAHTLAFVNDGRGDSRKPLSLLPCYHNFWKVVRELSNEERHRLLHFATGSRRPPPGGFSALTSYDGRLALFTLRGVDEKATHGYLQSHACFNRVDLPTYWGLKSMRRAIHAATSIHEDGFTIA